MKKMIMQQLVYSVWYVYSLSLAVYHQMDV